MTTTSSVWAATIHCPPAGAPVNCVGTNEADTMLGTAKDDNMAGADGDDTMFGFARNDQMTGQLGDDTMSGGSGIDFMVGGVGNDKVSGDSGDDVIEGRTGSDTLKGSSGNDIIFHNDQLRPTFPDLGKDTIDCGSGNNDEAFINVGTDHDTAINCETVHSQ